MSTLLALTITLRFNSWHTPALITLISFLFFVFVCWRESKQGGDYSIPLFSFMTFCIFCTATAVSWLVFFLT